MVYVSKPVNVTGVTLSNPVCADGTYVLDFTTGVISTFDVPSYSVQNPAYLPPVEYTDYTTLGDWKYNRPVANINYYAYSHGVTSYFGPVFSYQANGLEIRSADGVNDYLCKDYGVDYFTGDLDFSFSLQDIQENRIWSAGWPILFSLSNIAGGTNAGRMAELYGLLLNHGTYLDVYKIFYLYVNGVAVDSITYTGSWPVPAMYIRFRRVAGITTVTIYEDAAMTTPWTHGNGGKYILTNALADNTNYRYCYILVNQIASGIQAMYWTFWNFRIVRKYLSWGGGTPVSVSGSGIYTLDDGSGNTIDATVDVSELPSSDEDDDILICNIPIVTNAGTDVLSTSFTANGEIYVSGATTRGYCYKLSSISGDPTVADSKVNETGSFVAEEYDLPVTGVLKETEYKVAAYMIIDGDTYYGDTELVHTPFGSLYIAITPVDEIIDLGETQQYTVTSYQDDGSTLDVTDLCTYTSSDTNVATISNDPATIGLATATSTVISTPDWNYGTGWSVIGGYAIHTGETSGLMISGMVTEIEATLTVYEGTFTDATDLIVTFFTSGGNYTIQFYVTGMGTGASVTPYIGATAGVAVTESGCHVQNLVAPATGRYLNFDATGTLAIQRVLIFVEKNFTASTEQTELPSQYQHLMVLYATACGLNKDKKFQSAQVTELMYNNELNYVKTNLEDIVPDSKKDLRR